MKQITMDIFQSAPSGDIPEEGIAVVGDDSSIYSCYCPWRPLLQRDKM